MPSGSSSTSTPMRRRFSATVAMRSVSLMRSSRASRTVSPSSLAAPSTASTGISSISAAVASFSMMPPRTAECSTSISPDQLAVGALQLQDLARRAPIAGQQIEQRRAGGVQPHAADGQRRAGHEQRRHDEERRRGEVRRHAHFAPGQLRAPVERDRLRAPRKSPRRTRASAISRVVARAHRLAHRSHALGEEPRQQHARLHLRARHRQRVIDRPQRRRPGSRAAGTARRAPRSRAPISRQRLHDALHGPARKRLVPRDPAAERLRRQDPGEHADGGAGVAGIEVRRRRAQPVEPPAADRHLRPALLDLDAERAAGSPASSGNPPRSSSCEMRVSPSAMAAIIA